MIWLWCALAFGGPLEDGLAAYDAGDWDAAADAWGAVEDPSGAVLMNLGSAEYRRGDLPRAIALWRGAARTRPRDGDLAHDLAIARGGLDDLPAPVDPPVAWQAFVTVGELGLLATGLLAFFSVGTLVRRRRREPGSPWPVVAAGVAGVTLGLAALSGAHAVVQHPVAVVVDDVAVVRDAARPEAQERFRLRPGAEVRVERSLSGFVLVTAGDGRRGWVPTGALLSVGIPGSGTEAW